MLVAGSTVAEKAPPVLLGVSGPLLFRARVPSNVQQIRQGFRPPTPTPASLSSTPAPLLNPPRTSQSLSIAFHEHPPS